MVTQIQIQPIKISHSQPIRTLHYLLHYPVRRTILRSNSKKLGKLLWEIAGLNYYGKLRSPNFLFRTSVAEKLALDWSVKSGALKIPFSVNRQKSVVHER